jgi:hypothetical protein
MGLAFVKVDLTIVGSGSFLGFGRVRRNGWGSDRL